MLGVTRVLTCRGRGIARCSPAFNSHVAASGSVAANGSALLLQQARSRGIDLRTNGSPDNPMQSPRAHNARSAINGVTCQTSEVSCVASSTSFSLSSLEMTGRHALVTWCSGYPSARRLTKSSDGMKQ